MNPWTSAPPGLSPPAAVESIDTGKTVPRGEISPEPNPTQLGANGDWWSYKGGDWAESVDSMNTDMRYMSVAAAEELEELEIVMEMEPQSLWDDVPQAKPEGPLLCVAHGVVCKKGICSEYSRQLRQILIEKERAEGGGEAARGRGRGKGRGSHGGKKIQQEKEEGGEGNRGRARGGGRGAARGRGAAATPLQSFDYNAYAITEDHENAKGKEKEKEESGEDCGNGVETASAAGWSEDGWSAGVGWGSANVAADDTPSVEGWGTKTKRSKRGGR